MKRTLLTYSAIFFAALVTTICDSLFAMILHDHFNGDWTNLYWPTHQDYLSLTVRVLLIVFLSLAVFLIVSPQRLLAPSTAFGTLVSLLFILQAKLFSIHHPPMDPAFTLLVLAIPIVSSIGGAYASATIRTHLTRRCSRPVTLANGLPFKGQK